MTSVKLPYEEFLRAKVIQQKELGFELPPSAVNKMLKPHQRDMVLWALRKGRGVIGVSLDEASVLRGRGNKTFGEFAFKHFRDCRFKYVATATPSPNEYQELLSYSAFLDVMDISAARTRFFKRNSTKMDALTLHPHKEREFWLWLSTWAVFVQKPSDLGYSDEGYSLPELDIRWHEVETNFHHGDTEARRNTEDSLLYGTPGDGNPPLPGKSIIAEMLEATEKAGGINIKSNSSSVSPCLRGRSSAQWQQGKLLRGENISMIGAAREEAQQPGAADQEDDGAADERRAIENATALTGTPSVSVYGSQDLTEREDIIVKFSDGRIHELAAKPVIAGSGCNFQRHCAWAIFLGIGWKFNDFIQAIHRIHRFLQTKRVRIDLIYTDAERDIRAALEAKWQRHKELTANMAGIIRQYGLATNALQKEMSRVMGVERREIVGERFLLACNDTVLETRGMESNTEGMICTSLPFSTQYEYTPSYHDFGHTEDNDHFFAQMDYLTPELLRVLKPGRVAAIHCKDRIMPGGMTGLGFQTVYPFHSDIIRHFTSHGFAFLGMKDRGDRRGR